jgi:hypothetical protein
MSITNRLFTYSSTPIPGASHSGNLAISTTYIPGYTWWGGPDENLGYVIAHSDTNSGGNRTERGKVTSISGNTVGFWRTATQSDSAFLTMFNGLFNQNYVTASTAADWLNTNGYWTSYSGSSSTLGTIGNPAVSAQAIYNSGQTTNGWYYIQTSNMASPRQIYCNMTDQGGGWMLMTYNPDATTTGGTPYPNQWLGGTGSFASRVSIDTRQVWYHNGTAQCTQVMKMASATASLTPLLSNIVIANKVVYINPNNLRLSATFSSSSAVFANNTPMSGTWSAIKGHTLMTGPLNVNAPGDWVYNTGGQWWTVCGPSTAFPDPQGRSGNAQGSGSWTNMSNSNIYGMVDVAATTNSLRTDIKTYAVYIK